MEKGRGRVHKEERTDDERSLTTLKLQGALPTVSEESAGGGVG